MAVEDLDVVGVWPDLTGKTLDQLIAQESWFEGELDDEANVIWLQVAGDWHRLYFDNDAIYWATAPNGPRAKDAAPDEEPEFPLNDLTAKFSLGGATVSSTNGQWIEDGTEVTLHFEGGKTVTFRNRFDTTTVLVG